LPPTKSEWGAPSGWRAVARFGLKLARAEFLPLGLVADLLAGCSLLSQTGGPTKQKWPAGAKETKVCARRRLSAAARSDWPAASVRESRSCKFNSRPISMDEAPLRRDWNGRPQLSWPHSVCNGLANLAASKLPPSSSLLHTMTKRPHSDDEQSRTIRDLAAAPKEETVCGRLAAPLWPTCATKNPARL